VVCHPIRENTVNGTAEMETLVSLGADGMFTNFPDRLDAVLHTEAADAMVAARQSVEGYGACRAGR
jgi:hypothetical protein